MDSQQREKMRKSIQLFSIFLDVQQNREEEKFANQKRKEKSKRKNIKTTKFVNWNVDSTVDGV